VLRFTRSGHFGGPRPRALLLAENLRLRPAPALGVLQRRNPPLRLRDADRQLWICAGRWFAGWRNSPSSSPKRFWGGIDGVGRSWVLAIKSGAEEGTTINFPACLVPRVLFHSTLISYCVSAVARGTLGSYPRLTSRRLHGPAYPPLGRPLGAGLFL
jgi:hypothetical protein